MMKINLKQITSFILTFLLISSMFCTSAAADGRHGEKFAGSRIVDFSVDCSDLDVAINGSRPAFDLILRKTAPEWLTYNLSAKGRDLILSLSFRFDSFEDYSVKSSELLCYSANIVYSDNKELLLIEGYKSAELLNFLEYALEAQDCLGSNSLSNLFSISRNEIILGGSMYSGDERMEIRESGNTGIKFSGLSINTEWNDDGSLTRSIEVRFDQDTALEEDKLSIKKRFETVDGAEITDALEQNNTLSVKFQALSENQLSMNTMLCLDAASAISNKYHFVDENTVTVERIEFIDYTRLLNEDASFYYGFIFPSYVTELKSDNRDVDVYYNRLSANRLDEISCRFNVPPFFTSIELTTDMSNIFGKISKTVSLEMPLEIAPAFHESIKEQLGSELTDGCALDIYDAAGRRFYRVSFSSYFMKDIEEFNTSMLGKRSRTRYSDSWIPFGQSEIREVIDLDNLPFSTTPMGEVRATYKGSALMKIDRLSAAGSDSKEVSFPIKDGSSISFAYRRLNTLKLLPVIFVLFLVLVVAFISAIRKRQLKHTKTSKIPKPQGLSESAAVQYRKYEKSRSKHRAIIVFLVFLYILILAAGLLFALSYFGLYKLPTLDSFLRSSGTKTGAEEPTSSDIGSGENFSIDFDGIVVNEVPSSNTEYSKSDDADLSGIPSTAVKFNEHYYQIYTSADLPNDDKAIWNSASDFCESMGGHLACISSAEENDFISSHISQNGYDTAFIGFSNLSEDGIWLWANNEPVIYTNWSGGVTDSARPGEFFAILTKDGLWTMESFMDASPSDVIAEIVFVSASSELVEGDVIHSASRVNDATLEAAWAEGVDGNGIGESLYFEFDRDYSISKVLINAGYQKSEDLYDRNSRPAVITLTFSDGTSESHSLADYNGQQTILLEEPRLTRSVTLTIDDVFPGTAYTDTVISEMSFLCEPMPTAFVCEWDGKDIYSPPTI